MKTKFIAAALALSSVAVSGCTPPVAQEDALGYAYSAVLAEDYVEAAKWFRVAAKQGNADAQLYLGGMYDDGEGVPENDADAAKWYRLAAEQGNATAQMILGAKYLNGEGVPEDFVQAYKWTNLAAAQGNDAAIQGKEFMRNLMTPEQIAEAQKLSSEWKPVGER